MLEQYLLVYKRPTDGKKQKVYIKARSKDHCVALCVMQYQGTFVSAKRVNRSVQEQVDKLLLPHQDKWCLNFSRQTLTMIKAGIPIDEIFRGLAKNEQNEYIRTVLYKVYESIREGNSVHAAMSLNHDVFPLTVIKYTRLAEVSGSLEQCYGALCDYYAKKIKTQGRVKRELRPHLFNFLAMFASMFIVVLIGFPPVYEQMAKEGLEPTLSMEIINTLVMSIVDYYNVIPLVIILVVWTYKLAKKQWRREHDKLLFKIPVFGKLFELESLATWANNCSMLVKAGLPIDQALTEAGQATNNEYINFGSMRMTELVCKGYSLTQSAQTAGFLTPLALHSLEVGEKSGAVDTMLHNVATMYHEEVEQALADLNENAGFLMLCVIGVMLVILSYAVLLPQIDLIKASLN